MSAPICAEVAAVAASHGVAVVWARSADPDSSPSARPQ
jgi:hypothetical protein